MNNDITNIIKFEIYKILLNNKIYIGITRQGVKKRLFQHIYSAYCNSDKYSKKHTHLSHAIRKYGSKNIIVEILETVYGENSAIEREIYYIDLYDSSNPLKGYNMLKSSGIGVNKNKEFYKSTEYKKKRSEVVKGINNGRYTGFTDKDIIEYALRYFKEYGNIRQSEWFKFCKIYGLPQVYDKTSKFRFNGQGIDGFYKEFLMKCDEMMIDVKFSDIVSLKSRKKVLERLKTIFIGFTKFQLTDEELRYFEFLWPKKVVSKSNSN